nr:hypothetical protein [uncultured Aminipila sp.]
MCDRNLSDTTNHRCRCRSDNDVLGISSECNNNECRNNNDVLGTNTNVSKRRCRCCCCGWCCWWGGGGGTGFLLKIYALIKYERFFTSLTHLI